MCVCIIYVCMYEYVWSGRKWKWKSLSRVQLFATPWTISPWNSLGQNTGVGSLSLLQGIFPTQGSNPGLPTLQEDSLPAEPQGKPEFQSKSHTFPRYQKAMKIFSFAIKKMIQSLHVNITAKYLEFNFMHHTAYFLIL